jgi:predicted exporter
MAGGARVAGVVGDPVLARAEGAALLSRAATREANIRAYNDVFRLVAALAAAVTLFLALLTWRRARRARAAAKASS